MKSLRYLEQAVGMVLGFVGMKMAGSFVGVEIPPAESLGIILTLLGGGVTLSYLNPIPDDAEQASNSPGEAAEEPAMDGAKRALDQVDKVIPASLQRGLADGRLRFPELESWVRSAARRLWERRAPSLGSGRDPP
mmetsp:Transcript_39465/g.104851  ORF Transcript_39465/g.104851 Transcript_39465/m.104851 type:complete len:135 (+) Transcript_39465:446-850(+)